MLQKQVPCLLFSLGNAPHFVVYAYYDEESKLQNSGVVSMPKESNKLIKGKCDTHMYS
jgi:hypothetical protein